MALVQYTGIVNQLRGKLNGSVFNKFRTGYSLQRKQHPPVGSRGNQSVIRARYSTIQRHWSTLTVAQQNSWQTCATNNPTTDRFGEPTTLAGYNQFIKANLYRLSIGLELQENAFVGTANLGQEIDGQVSNLNVTSNEFGETIVSGNFSCGGVASSLLYSLIDMSLPVSTGVTVYHRNFRRVGWGLRGSFSTSFSFEANLGSSFPAISPGMVLWFSYRTLHPTSGAVSPRQFIRFVVPEATTIDAWSVTYAGVGIPSPVEIAYADASIGVPPFYSIVVRFTPGATSPPPRSAAVSRDGLLETALTTSNTANTFITLAPGFYMGWLVQLVFSQTGQVVDESYTVIQNS